MKYNMKYIMLVISVILLLGFGGSVLADWTSGKYGSAFDFDGASNFIYAGDVGTVQSVSFWVKSDSLTQKIMTLDGGTHYIEIDASNQIQAQGFSSPTIYVDGISTSTITTGNWHHIAVVTDTAIDASGVFWGKVNITGTNHFFDGIIDELYIYDRALSARDIRYHYNSGAPVAHWKMDEGHGQTAYDSSDNNNNGTLGATTATSTDDPTWIAGKYGTALSFDGVNDYVNCYDSSTQVLTRESVLVSSINTPEWKYFKDLKKNDEILTLNPDTGEQEWHIPDRYIASPYQGEMLKIQSQGVDLLVTPDHQMFVAEGDNDFELVLAEEIANKDIKLLVQNYESSSRSIVEVSAGEMEWQEYDGMVYDVTVENHILLVRRNLSNKKETSQNEKDSFVTASRLANHRLSPKFNFSIANQKPLSSPLAVENKKQSLWSGRDSNPHYLDDNQMLYQIKLPPRSGTADLLYQEEVIEVKPQSTSDGGLTSFSVPVWSGNCGDDDSLNITDAITIEAWAYSLDAYNDADFFIITSSMAWGRGEFIARNVGAKGIIRFQGETTDDHQWSVDSPQLDTNTWYHFVGTYNGTTFKLYTNGILSNSEDYTDTLKYAGNVNIGCRDGTNYPFNGSIDDVRIYNYARSASEIEMDYQQGLAAHFGDDGWGAMMDYGLVGYWGFNEGSGGTVYDGSNESNDGTWNGSGSHWTSETPPAKSGFSGQFNGVDDFINCGNDASLNITDEITIEAWVNANSLAGRENIGIVSKRSANTGYMLLFKDLSGERKLEFFLNGWAGEAIFPTSLNINTWYHVVGKYDLSRTYVYVNGVEQTGVIYTSPIVINSANVTIGQQGIDYFNGTIDEVRIYNRALSAEEIRYHYNRGAPVAHWRLDEGTGKKAFDESWNNNDGILYNGTAVGDGVSAGPIWQKGAYGSALEFDGVNDYVDCGNDSSLDITDAITVSAWVKPATSLTSGQNFVGRDESAGRVGLGGGWTSGKFKWWIYNGSWVNSGDSITTVISDTWYHLVGTYDKDAGTNNIKLYVDGVLEAQNTITGAIDNKATILAIGQGTNTAEKFSGTIDDVRIYNYARSQSQILQDYNNGLSTHFE